MKSLINLIFIIIILTVSVGCSCSNEENDQSNSEILSSRTSSSEQINSSESVDYIQNSSSDDTVLLNSKVDLYYHEEQSAGIFANKAIATMSIPSKWNRVATNENEFDYFNYNVGELDIYGSPIFSIRLFTFFKSVTDRTNSPAVCITWQRISLKCNHTSQLVH